MDDGLTINPPKEFLWRCINGHEFKLPSDEYHFMTVSTIERDGKTLTKNIDICPLCYADQLNARVAKLYCAGEIKSEV